MRNGKKNLSHTEGQTLADVDQSEFGGRIRTITRACKSSREANKIDNGSLAAKVLDKRLSCDIGAFHIGFLNFTRVNLGILCTQGGTFLEGTHIVAPPGIHRTLADRAW